VSLRDAGPWTAKNRRYPRSSRITAPASAGILRRPASSASRHASFGVSAARIASTGFSSTDSSVIASAGRSNTGSAGASSSSGLSWAVSSSVRPGIGISEVSSGTRGRRPWAVSASGSTGGRGGRGGADAGVRVPGLASPTCCTTYPVPVAMSRAMTVPLGNTSHARRWSAGTRPSSSSPRPSATSQFRPCTSTDARPLAVTDQVVCIRRDYPGARPRAAG
jgi:hypothetical protein